MDQKTIKYEGMELLHPDPDYDDFDKRNFCCFCGKDLRKSSATCGEDSFKLTCKTCNKQYDVSNVIEYVRNDPHEVYKNYTDEQLEEYKNIIQEMIKLDRTFQDKYKDTGTTKNFNEYFYRFYLKQLDYLYYYQRERHEKKEPEGIPIRIRGIGNDFQDCFICGKREHENGCNHNISMFVNNKEDGEKIKNMFARGCFLDYRPHEPNWIQVKIGACGKHLINLEHLASKIRCYNWFLEKYIHDSTFLPLDVGYQDIHKKSNDVIRYIKEWLSTDYLAYHVDLGEYDGLGEKITQAKQSLDNIYNIIKERKIDTEADRSRLDELECECDNPEFEYKKIYDDKIDSVKCLNCETKFWYHGTWLKDTDEGWEIQFQPPEEAQLQDDTLFAKKTKKP